MITLLAITTAICFVAFIWAAVQVVVLQRILERVRRHEELLLHECRTLRDTLVDTWKERDRFKDDLRAMRDEFTTLTVKHDEKLQAHFAYIAEAVQAERQLQYERGLEWRGTLGKGVETLVELRTLFNEDGETVVTTKSLDEFVAKYATEETAEPEGE